MNAPLTFAEALTLADIVYSRIDELWKRRAWYRTHPGWIIQSAVDDREELRILLRMAREARTLNEREDGVPTYTEADFDPTLALGDHHVGLGR